MVISKHVVPNIRRRHPLYKIKNVLSPDTTIIILKIVIHIFKEVHIRIITLETVGDKHVFPSVVVIVGDQWSPAPVGVGNSSQLSDFAKASVTVIHMKHIAHVLVIK